MTDGGGHARQAGLHTNAAEWLGSVVAVLGLAWFVFLIAAVFHMGLLVSIFERYRVLTGCLGVLGSLAVFYVKLQLPPFRQRPFSWSTFAYGIVSASGFTALTYGIEAMYFPLRPNPGDAAIAVGALLVVLASYRVPSRLLAWISRHT